MPGARVVSGFEALLRWRHPESGMISPAIFIPLAEETGLIEQLGMWSLETACHQAAAWPGDLAVSVNLSPVQFKSPTLVADIRRALAKSGLLRRACRSRSPNPCSSTRATRCCRS